MKWSQNIDVSLNSLAIGNRDRSSSFCSSFCLSFMGICGREGWREGGEVRREVRGGRSERSLSFNTHTPHLHTQPHNTHTPHTHTTHTHTHTHTQHTHTHTHTHHTHKLYGLLAYTSQETVHSTSPPKKHTLYDYKHFELWGHWKCPNKSPSSCNNYVIPMSLYTFVSS